MPDLNEMEQLLRIYEPFSPKAQLDQANAAARLQSQMLGNQLAQRTMDTKVARGDVDLDAQLARTAALQAESQRQQEAHPGMLAYRDALTQGAQQQQASAAQRDQQSAELHPGLMKLQELGVSGGAQEQELASNADARAAQELALRQQQALANMEYQRQLGLTQAANLGSDAALFPHLTDFYNTILQMYGIPGAEIPVNPLALQPGGQAQQEPVDPAKAEAVMNFFNQFTQQK